MEFLFSTKKKKKKKATKEITTSSYPLTSPVGVQMTVHWTSTQTPHTNIGLHSTMSSWLAAQKNEQKKGGLPASPFLFGSVLFSHAHSQHWKRAVNVFFHVDMRPAARQRERENGRDGEREREREAARVFFASFFLAIFLYLFLFLFFVYGHSKPLITLALFS